MCRLSFSLCDYQNGVRKARFSPPDVFSPYYDVDPVLFRRHGTTDQRRGDLRLALEELRKRTDEIYYGKTYPLQARTLDYSARAFPAYRFVLPEVMTEDWLAIVDWGKFQRDHVLHQPLCGYIVLKLLDDEGGEPLLLPNGKTIIDTCVDSILRWDETSYIKDFLVSCGMAGNDPILRSPEIWRIFFREAAYVAAVFHDLGYPWQYSERLQANLDGLNDPALRQDRSVERVIRVFGKRLLFHPLSGYRAPDMASPSTWHDRIAGLTETALAQTHGLPGALGFLHLNDCVRRYPHGANWPLRLLCVEWASVAIMMHDMAGVYWGKGNAYPGIPDNGFLRVGFEHDPLSAIVTLADVLEEFERPNVTYGNVRDARGEERVALRYGHACSGTDLEIDPRGVMSIRYHMNSDALIADKRSRLLKEQREYFDSKYGYLDMGGLGITDVKMIAAR